MYNIWDFFNFTLSTTIVGLFLLLIKALFHDKLTARWHYLIWIVLLVRLLVPSGNMIITSPLSLLGSFQFSQRMALWQMNMEQNLQSLFSSPYTAFDTGISSGQMTQWQNFSMTDWLFVLYIAGVVLLSIFYLAVYVSLRYRIGRGLPADDSLQMLVQNTAAQYRIKSCREIRICQGFDTPFVCGLIRPVLVIPAQMADSMDEKMILHELLHVQYKDVLINFVIHAVRILNWCNPMMRLILNRIQNDSEAFCDQRVLERIEKEQYKQYGNLLLDLARSKYPTVVGTTSMANGKRNIKRRLKRIVDFSYVPQGHGVAACCITLLLTLSCVANATVPEPDFDTSVSDSASMERMLKNAQLYQVQTPEEAVNIFCRALEDANMGYMALVVPPDEWDSYKQWVRDIGKTGEDSYTAVLGERAFEDGERPITNEDGTYAFTYRDLRKTNPYFFFADGTLYRPVKWSEIGDRCIIQNLYQIDESTWRCQAIWDLQEFTEIESVYFDLQISKTYDWNIEILNVQQVKSPAGLQNIPDGLQNFQTDKWPVLAELTREHDGYRITVQQSSEGTFDNLRWGYGTMLFGGESTVDTFQRELDNACKITSIVVKSDKIVEKDTLYEIVFLPSRAEEDEIMEQCKPAVPGKSVSSDSWSYHCVLVREENRLGEVQTGFGTSGYWSKADLTQYYRVIIYENGVVKSRMFLPQEAMLYDR